MGFFMFLRSSFLILTLLILPFQLSAAKKYKYDLAVCAIFQNEAEYLREWIEFHKLVGVKHFYLYNNLSTDDYYKVLQPYIKSGEVELVEWKHETNPDGGNWSSIQLKAYKHALRSAKKKVKWLAIIDTDEFVFPVETDSLSKFLLNYEDVAAVCVNWQMYGTSKVKNILPGHLLIEDLIYKAPTDYHENTHVKSIVRPQYVADISNPHFCVFASGFSQVNSNKVPFVGPFSPVLVDKIRINHYWTRDEHFFQTRKLPRRQKWQDGGCIERANNINQEIDKAIFKYIPKLKQKMRLKNPI